MDQLLTVDDPNQSDDMETPLTPPVHVMGGNDDDRLVGGQGYDLISGGNGDDTIFAGQADTADGNAGGLADGDTISGGAGDDVIFAGVGNDLVIGGLNLRIEDGDGEVSDGSDRLFGGMGNDFIYGGSFNPQDFFLVDSDPTVAGYAPLLIGTGGDVSITSQSSDDTTPDIMPVDDTMAVLIEVDPVNNDDGMVTPFAYGDDTLGGGPGDDYVIGAGGDDLIYGGPGSDTVNGVGGNDTVFGGAGDDNVEGFEGDDFLFAGAGDDRVAGWTGDDVLYGGAGSDLIEAGNGADTLYGGAGNDRLYGGDQFSGDEDRDVFSFTDGHGQDVISDFDIDRDVLRIATVDAGFSHIDAVVAASVIAEIGGETGIVIDTGGGDSVFLVGLDLDDLTQVEIVL